MATIKPTLTLTSNQFDQTTPGPLSFALSLSVTDDHTVDDVIMETTATTAVSGSPVLVYDGSALNTTSPTTYTAGTNGCWLYLKHTGKLSNFTDAAASDLIAIGIVSHVVSNGEGSPAAYTGNDAPPAPAADSANTTGLMETANTTLRTMTLKPGEFAFFPWDYTGDIYIQSTTANTSVLEHWLFDR
jgi:hypothetical protein